MIAKLSVACMAARTTMCGYSEEGGIQGLADLRPGNMFRYRLTEDSSVPALITGRFFHKSGNELD
jgi:hypothetical protein